MAIGADELETRFIHHPPTENQARRMARLRGECLELARVIDDLVPDGREKADALTNLDYVMYQSNAGIARREPR